MHDRQELGKSFPGEKLKVVQGPPKTRQSAPLLAGRQGPSPNFSFFLNEAYPSCFGGSPSRQFGRNARQKKSASCLLL